MHPGRLPKPPGEAARRNAARIPTTALPPGGVTDDPPDPPFVLGAAGARWWEWAWHTPQAAAWSVGDLYFVAHRAQLEEQQFAIDKQGELVPWSDSQAVRVRNDMDDRLGLTPKGMAALRWRIIDQPATPIVAEESTRGLTLVDAAAS